MMRRQILVIVAFLALALPVKAETVVAILDNASSMLAVEAPQVLALLKAELQRRGLWVSEQTVSMEDQAAAESALSSAGVSRVFVLSLMPLGEKRVVGLAERRLPGLAVTRSERLTAARIEELDTVLPRLVDALLSGKPVDETAQVSSVTEQEARPWRHKPGGFFWGLGIPFGASLRRHSEFSYGAGLRLAYEMEHARIDADSFLQLNAKEKMFHWNVLSVGAAYLPLAGDISPFVGGGVAFGGSTMDDREGDMGVVFNVGGGVEFFRLHKTRLLADLRIGLPTYRVETDAGERWVPVLTFTVFFLW